MRPFAYAPRPFSPIGVDIKILAQSGFSWQILAAADQSVVAIPLETMTGEEVAEGLATEIFLNNLSPELMPPDSGGYLKADIEAAALERFDVRSWLKSPSGPQSNGMR